MNLATFGAIALVALAAAAPAGAEPAKRRATHARAIDHADLDLGRAQDAAVMFARIRKAAAQVCRATPGAPGRYVGTILVYEDCFRASVQEALDRLDAPLVTAEAVARSGGAPGTLWRARAAGVSAESAGREVARR